MSISSLTVAKFQFPWAREEERDLRDQKQIVALTAALQASLARETASRQANAELLQRRSHFDGRGGWLGKINKTSKLGNEASTVTLSSV